MARLLSGFSHTRTGVRSAAPPIPAEEFESASLWCWLGCVPRAGLKNNAHTPGCWTCHDRQSSAVGPTKTGEESRRFKVKAVPVR